MKFQDLFIPKWRRSNPKVRIKAVANLTDSKLIEQIAERDEDADVRKAAAARLISLQEES
jgi:hypothetical protein